MRTILLDTHVALWSLTNSSRLPGHIRDALRGKEFIWIFHQASLWEIQIKYLLGKLPLPSRPDEFVPDAIRAAGFQEARLENEGIYFLSKLPNHHSDPFDRILLAHAICNGWEVVTMDAHWESYPVRIFRG